LGSVLTLAAGALSVVNGAQGLIFGGEFPFGELPVPSHFDVCGVILVLLGVLAIAGAVATLMLKRLSPGLAGAVCGMLGGGLFGFWLGLAALIVYIFSDTDL
jgi:hypothetical protein